MAKYAYVENGNIIDVVNELPESWRNISGLRAMRNEPEMLKTIGWHQVVLPNTQINPHTQKLDAPTYEIVDGEVYQRDHVIDITEPQRYIPHDWIVARAQRNGLMDAMRFRYERYQRNERLSLPQVDDLAAMDQYMKALADITTDCTDPQNIIWPEYQPPNN